MKVLMVTPAVDSLHPVHGFIYSLVEQIAQRVDKLYVITLTKGNDELPNKTEVYSLGVKKNKPLKLLYLGRLLLKLLPQVDLVFTHMYPMFPLLVWPFARLFRKPIVMWRTHCYMNLMTRLDHALVNRVVTASKESFRIKSHKVKVIGHSVDLEEFSFHTGSQVKDGPVILSVGRVSPVKNFHILVEAIHILVKEYSLSNSRLILVGGPGSTAENDYFEMLKASAREKKIAEHCDFTGPVPFNQVADFYHRADIFVNATPTGSFDRVVLEAMASGCLPLVCNEAFFPFLGKYCPVLTFKENDPPDLARKIADLHSMPQKDKDEMRIFLRKMVEAEHSYNARLSKLISVFQEVLDKR